MHYDYSASNLPVTDIIPGLKQLFVQNNTVILSAPPGAGKSTLLPLVLAGEQFLGGKKIIMLEPRRLAAKTIASRLASLNGDDTGKTVGYRIRFDTRVSETTQIEVVTEGILTRILHNDNALEDYALVIFDEFHERSLHADLALALCREAQQVLRPELRILIMSATLDTQALHRLLGAPVIESKGRQHPVEILYGDDADPFLLAELAAATIAKAIREQKGDVLVFLPGEGEIKKCEDLIDRKFDGVSVFPLYGQLSYGEQQRAITPSRDGRRRIVLATSIAETSLTIEGVSVVVDCGFGRSSRFDPRSGLTKLETARISKDSADQRAGRAGRLGPGVCYRMWTMATHSRLAENRIPEILDADLAPLMLDMAAWGVSDIQKLTWLTPPPKGTTAQAAELLEQLGATQKGKITPHGKLMHSLTCHPRIAHMLLMADNVEQKQLGTDIAAVLEERDPLPKDSGIDINLRVEALRRLRSMGNSGGRFARIEKVATQYRGMLNLKENNAHYDPHEAGLLLAYAFPERIAFARPGNNAQFQLANGRYAASGHRDDLAHEPWLVAANVDQREGLGKIFLAAPLNPKDLLPMVKEEEVLAWDTRKGGLISRKDLRIGTIVLQSKPLVNYNKDEAEKVIWKAIQNEGVNILDFGEEMTLLQNRILSLRRWNEKDEWPDVNTATLIEADGAWLRPYLRDIKKADDLKKVNLAEALLHSLSYDQQNSLSKLAPSKLEVPSGSKIQIKYFPNGDTPVLAVRLQELFGLAETPTVNGGKNPLVLHLLSPGYKPVQVTSDLKSFWNNLYHEVKKELQRRYPKHSWPDDPWSAKAVAKGKSHK